MGKIKRRETDKMDICRTHLNIYEARYKLEDFDGSILNEINAIRMKEQNINALSQQNVHSTKPDKNKVVVVSFLGLFSLELVTNQQLFTNPSLVNNNRTTRTLSSRRSENTRRSKRRMLYNRKTHTYLIIITIILIIITLPGSR